MLDRVLRAWVLEKRTVGDMREGVEPVKRERERERARVGG